MRRSVDAGGLAAWCERGEGRRRRARVEECVSVTAEGVYAVMLRDARWMLQPGATGELSWIINGRSRPVVWEVRANRLWRHGRMFLNCAGCGRRATRIYAPADASAPACRLCWGLAYQSQQFNYRPGGPLRAFGISHRQFAQRLTSLKRQRARATARARLAARRTLWNH
jgi:hypothetical protein